MEAALVNDLIPVPCWQTHFSWTNTHTWNLVLRPLLYSVLSLKSEI